MHHCKHLLRLLLLLSVGLGVISSPTPTNNEVDEIFTGAKRDVSTAAASANLKSALYNPYLYPPGYSPIFPLKPYFYPFLTPPEVLLSRISKTTQTQTASPQTTLQTASPAMATYFKAKKNEFLTKLFDQIAANATDSSELTTRSVTPAASDNSDALPPKPTIDPSFFINKKLDFLDILFKSLNTTTAATPTAPALLDGGTDVATTPKPTIVPPSFWFPFIKPPKPPKAPKPTKPPKAKKVLKDALDAAILQSLLADLGYDSVNGTLNKRGVVAPPVGGKKGKTKKVKAEEDPTEFHIPLKIDPTLYSTKASDCLDKLFKILSKADAEDLSNFIEPKATVIPANLWTQPSATEYTSKLDAFLDLLVKALNATDEVPASNSAKSSKSKKTEYLPKVIRKRSTFLDELLHRIPPSPASPTVAVAPVSGKVKCSDDEETSDKSARSLIFKPFGSGFWIPQYLYATKMSMYMDKLMDTINMAAVEDVASESASLKKRSVGLTEDGKVNITGLSPKEAALTLLISELVDVKNNIVDAFGDGVKAQKSATTAKPYGPGGKSFKKPFWGPKPSPTPDPVEPIQKRIDILNDIFDKITDVEKALLFAEGSDDPDVARSMKDNSQTAKNGKIGSPKLGASKMTKVKITSGKGEDFDTPEDYVDKTREFLMNLYANKLNGLTDDSE